MDDGSWGYQVEPSIPCSALFDLLQPLHRFSGWNVQVTINPEAEAGQDAIALHRFEFDTDEAPLQSVPLPLETCAVRNERMVHFFDVVIKLWHA